MKATAFEHRINHCLLVKIKPNKHAEPEEAWEWSLCWHADEEISKRNLGAPNKYPLAYGTAPDPEGARIKALIWFRSKVAVEL